MKMQPGTQGEYALERRIDRDAIEAMRQAGPIAKLSVAEIPRITRGHARLLRALPHVERLWLWCDTSRLALSDIIQLPGLRIVDVFALRVPGRLRHSIARARSKRCAAACPCAKTTCSPSRAARRCARSVRREPR